MSEDKKLQLGVLAVQGDVLENISALEQASASLGIDIAVHAVKTIQQITFLDGLIIPGGESTTIGKLSLLAEDDSFDVDNNNNNNGNTTTTTDGTTSATTITQQIINKAKSGMPILGICAGMVLLARTAHDKTVGKTKQPLLGLLDIQIERNSFGRQRDSFESDVSLDSIGIPKYPGVFIRAPSVLISDSSSSSVDNATSIEVLARLGQKIVAVKKGNIIGVSFHPELTTDLAIHKYFINLTAKS